MPRIETYPKHLFDYCLWPIIKILWEPISLKRSHWWHWKKISNKNLNLNKTINILGHKKSKNRNGYWNNFWQTNMGWKKSIVLDTVARTRYQIGYIDNEKTEICSIILSGPTAVLIGPKETQFFAISYPDGKQIELKSDKKMVDKHLHDIPLI